MISEIKFISLDVHKCIPVITVNWNDTMEYLIANSQFEFKCTKVNPLIIKDGDELPVMNRILVEELMRYMEQFRN